MTRKTRPAPSSVPATRDSGQVARNNEGQEALFLREINSRRRAFAEILPEAFTPERFTALVLQSFRANPKLFQCDMNSVLKAAFQCAKLGLEPDSPAQLCYLIPYKREAQFVLGYQGAKVLAARDGRVAKIWAEHRYENDHWRLVRGTNARIEHEPTDGDRGRYMGTYAVVEYVDPRVKPSFEYVDALDMIRVEAHSHGCDVSKVEGLHKKAETDWRLAQKPWFKWRDRMRLKTAIKRVCKQVIAFDGVGAQLRAAFRLDDIAEAGKSQAAHLPTEVPTISVRQDRAAEVIAEDVGGSLSLADAPPEIETTATEKAPEEHEEPEEISGAEREAAIDAFAKLASETTKKFPDLADAVNTIAVSADPPDVKTEALKKVVADHEDRMAGGLTPEEEEAMANGGGA